MHKYKIMIKHEKWQLNNLRLLLDDGRVENRAARRVDLILRRLECRLGATIGSHDSVVVTRLAKSAMTAGVQYGQVLRLMSRTFLVTRLYNGSMLEIFAIILRGANCGTRSNS